MFVALVMCAIIWWNREKPVIRASSPAFLVGVMVGITGDLIGIIIQEGKPTPNLCQARFIVPSLSLTVILANLFVKTWRVWRIFDNKRMKKITISNFQLLQMIFGLLSIEAVLFVIWYNLDSPVPAPYFGDWICTSSVQDVFQLALQGYKLILLAFGAFLGYGIRNVQMSQFNESRQIAFSIYNILFTSILVAIVNYNVDDLQAHFIVTSGGELFIIWGIIFTLYLPKVYALYNLFTGREEEFGFTNGTRNGMSRSTVLSKSTQLNSQNSMSSLSSKTTLTTSQVKQPAPGASKPITDETEGFQWD
jgi:hypothetical protein